MINLTVEPYCHDCPNFEAEVVKVYGENKKVLKTNVKCVNCGKCAAIYNHLKRNSKKEND